MAFTLNINEKILHWDEHTLVHCLKEVATSPKTKACWEFAEQLGMPVQKVLNQLKTQILETDDKNLISLFRRAVRNHDAIRPTEQADPVPLYNKHYQKPPFLIPHINLTLDVQEKEVVVTTELNVTRNSGQESLILDAQKHDVLEVFINGEPLNKKQYNVTEHEIIFYTVPSDESFNVKIVSQINPFDNKSGEGLYKCGQWLTTHCESEGARCIYPTLDRPDVLSRYTTTIIADPIKYPCRISNGNLISETLDEKGRATIKWEDPFPKPSYLFATVMGDFGILKDTFKTRSGQEVTIEVFMQKGKEKRAEFSLSALKKAMRYEEEYFDREYDLDSLKMVAMPDFNIGAMENKGLIIFNEGCILVDPECATDMDYFWVEYVISHEYCHNWSGNRVTVRNWFELALKEAFTDFRSSQFIQWKYGDELVRPYEAKFIREKQYPEDASAAAHPIQVQSYIDAREIYDNTTYVKGREVFRMLKIILDRQRDEVFRIAQNVYFDRFDGQAVTFRELLQTLQEVSGVDLTQFERWFHQPGTPTVKAELEYQEETEVAKVHLSQTCLHPITEEEQLPFHIPLNIELLDEKGDVIVPKHLIDLKEQKQTLVFEGVKKNPLPVFHHDFSAPIHMEYVYSNEELATILQSEKDPFAKKEAGEIYLKRIFRSAYAQIKETGEVTLPESMIHFYCKAMMSEDTSPLAKAELLDLPSIRSILEKEDIYDFVAAKKVRSVLKKELAKSMESLLIETLEKYPEPATYDPDGALFKEEIAARKLRNSCYAFLSLIPEGKYNDMIIKAYAEATNFNNQFSLLNVIIEMDDPRRDTLLNEFFERWKNDGTILCNWITAQTGASTCTIEILDKIFNTEGFLKENPDHMRSLIRRFVNNLAAFHTNPGETYKYVTDRVLEFGKINPSVTSSYLASEAYQDYAKLPLESKALMKEQLKRLAAPSVDKMIRSLANKYLES